MTSPNKNIGRMPPETEDLNELIGNVNLNEDIHSGPSRAENVTRKARCSTGEKKRGRPAKNEEELFPKEHYEYVDDVSAYRPIIVESRKTDAFALFRIIKGNDRKWHMMRREKESWATGVNDLHKNNKGAEVSVVKGWVNVSNSMRIGQRLKLILKSHPSSWSSDKTEISYTLKKEEKDNVEAEKLDEAKKLDDAEKYLVSQIQKIIKDTLFVLYMPEGELDVSLGELNESL